MLTNTGLVEWAKAWLKIPTRYGWGCWGQPITADLIQRKYTQYPSHYTWARRAFLSSLIGKAFLIDCVGLIKGYYWDSNNTPGDNDVGYIVATDESADSMYQDATVKGPILSMPEIPGLCVHMSGHIGIYVGKGKVIESTRGSFGDGVVQTNIWDRQWLHWLECPYISYTEGEVKEDMKVPVELPDQAVTINGTAITGGVLLSVGGENITYIPARALRDAGQTVSWDASTNTVNIVLNGGK